MHALHVGQTFVHQSHGLDIIHAGIAVCFLKFLYLVDKYNLLLVGNFLCFCELIESPSSFEDESVALYKGLDITSLIHIQNLESRWVHCRQIISRLTSYDTVLEYYTSAAIGITCAMVYE